METYNDDENIERRMKGENLEKKLAIKFNSFVSINIERFERSLFERKFIERNKLRMNGNL